MVYKYNLKAHGRERAPAPTMQIMRVNIDPLTLPAWNLSCKYMPAPRGVHSGESYLLGLHGVPSTSRLSVIDVSASCGY